MISLIYKIINIFVRSKKRSNVIKTKIDGITYTLLPDEGYIKIKIEREDSCFIIRIKDIKDVTELTRITNKMIEKFEKENKKKKIKIILGN
jgi:hypothetical protein